MTGSISRVVFFDRDGTLNEDVDFLADPAALRLIPGTGAAIARLNEAHVAVVVVTNQSGIARGLFGRREVDRVNEALDAALALEDAHIDGYFVCPHHPDFTGPCECRKPGVGLFREAVRMLGLSLEGALMVGDKASDIASGFALGIRTALVMTGYGSSDRALFPDDRGRAPDVVVPDAAAAISWYLD